MKEKTDKKIVFYMTQKEKELLQKHCDNLSVKISSFLRVCTLNKIGKMVKEIKNEDINFLSYLSEVSANANNLNQIAKKVNQGLELNILDERKIQSQIKIIIDQLNEIKSKL